MQADHEEHAIQKYETLSERFELELANAKVIHDKAVTNFADRKRQRSNRSKTAGGPRESKLQAMERDEQSQAEVTQAKRMCVRLEDQLNGHVNSEVKRVVRTSTPVPGPAVTELDWKLVVRSLHHIRGLLAATELMQSERFIVEANAASEERFIVEAVRDHRYEVNDCYCSVSRCAATRGDVILHYEIKYQNYAATEWTSMYHLMDEEGNRFDTLEDYWGEGRTGSTSSSTTSSSTTEAKSAGSEEKSFCSSCGTVDLCEGYCMCDSCGQEFCAGCMEDYCLICGATMRQLRAPCGVVSLPANSSQLLQLT